MKTIALLTAAALLPLTASAAEKDSGPKRDLRQLLQQGLFEEEANRDTGKAAAAYTELVSQYEAQRSYAATALFRLAEIRGKEGNKAEAIALHQRLLTEFPMQEALVKLSKERLAQLGGEVPDTTAQLDAPTEAEAKELVKLREVVRNSPDLLNSATGEDGNTPLTRAAKNGWLVAAALALDSGALVNQGDGYPLRLAAMNGHKRMVELLIKRGADLHSGTDGRTALHFAAENKRVEVARVLLANGADPNGGDQKGDNTPLLLAISDTYDELTRLLLEKGADPARPGKDGIFPLITAVLYRNKEVITALLKRGADVNASNGQTALHVAAERWPEIVPFLLEHGASATAVATSRIGFTSPGVTPRTGFTPLHHTMLAFQDDGTTIQRPGDRLDSPLPLDKLAVLMASWQALLEHGADVNAPESQGISPFAMAAARPDLPIDALTFLVEKGASLEAGLAEGKSALSYAQGVSPERRLELETRFRFLEWYKDRGIRILNLCPSGSTVQPLIINESGSSTALPTAREALLMLAEQLKESMPDRFSVRLYRASKNKGVEKLAEIPFDVNKPIPELPPLQRGDVLVTFCDEQTARARRVRVIPTSPGQEPVSPWLRKLRSESTDQPPNASPNQGTSADQEPSVSAPEPTAP